MSFKNVNSMSTFSGLFSLTRSTEQCIKTYPHLRIFYKQKTFYQAHGTQIGKMLLRELNATNRDKLGYLLKLLLCYQTRDFLLLKANIFDNDAAR